MNENLKNLREEGSLDESIALNRITMQLLKDRAADCKRLWIALVISILVNLVLVGGFLWYESQWEKAETVTTITQDTGEGSGNNVYQSGESATYNEGGDKDGQADHSNQNPNQDQSQEQLYQE